MDSLINFDGMADVCNNLIDKFASAIGWIASHDTPRRIAISNYINEIQASDFDPLTKAALISNAQKSIKEYENQHKIYEIATQGLLPNAKPSNVDEDWLAQFLDKARLVSSSDFQILWGNILAEECNIPGSVPKALLHIMEQMDRTMAEGFMNIAAITVQWNDHGVRGCCPIYTVPSNDAYYEALGINHDLLVELQSIGLISIDLGFSTSCYSEHIDDSGALLQYHDETFCLPENQHDFQVGNVIYTNAGRALFFSVCPRKIPDFFTSHCVPLWNNQKVDENS